MLNTAQGTNKIEKNPKIVLQQLRMVRVFNCFNFPVVIYYSRSMLGEDIEVSTRATPTLTVYIFLPLFDP